MGGIGKTTLARLVYGKISHQFDVCIFLDDVRKVSTIHDLDDLQKRIRSQILMEENVQVGDVYSGLAMIKRCFCNKAVLLVLDNVDQSEELENLVGEKDWFGLRSRIIITTRNRRVLVTHGIEEPYELKGLNEDEALQLFSWKAFRNYEPEEDYAEQSKSFVRYAGGLPLALKILGSSLYKRSLDSWSSAFQKLKQTPNPTVFEILKVSFDGLDDMEKTIFLDIACFHKLYHDKSMIEQVYSSKSGFRIAIDVLVEKSLLTISYNWIYMHDLIQEMGCKIVCQENEEPGRRSRLWLCKDIFHVFTNNTGTEAIEGILLDVAEVEEADWNVEAFSKMCNLKLLYIHNLRLSVGPKFLPNALRFLSWSWCPSKSLPPCFQPDEFSQLTELSLVHSNIDHLWNGKKCLDNLKSINLSYSINLTRTPDFTGIPNLEKLVLEGCTNLVEIHPSIALLKRLKIWNFRNCKSIESLPSEVNMKFLETFDVSGCSKLKMIPEFVGQTKRLSKLCLGGSAVQKLPPSIEHLSESLVELDLNNGIVIREQPRSFFLKMQNLIVKCFCLFQRELNDCNLCDGEIPKEIGSLSSLYNTRRGFTDHLCDKLQWRGIKTFRDDPQLERGTAIFPELLTALEQSRFAIVVLSPNYGTSTWCLFELSKIFECMEESGTILPIFYEVDPSHVRHQGGSFAEAFEEHDDKFGKGNKEMEGSRDALTKVANLAGWTSKDYRYETKLIREIVQALWSKVHHSLTVFGSSEKLFGMDYKLEEIDVLLDKEANDVRFIGIWGMGGIGKTTLARLVYEKISHQFDVCIFLANVRKVSATHGLVHLQKQILSQVLKEENVQVWNVYSGMTMIKRCVCNKAVLLVLDDVDQSEQLEYLVGEKDFFGLRSRIIITTRDRHVLVTHGVEKPYELKGLYKDEALQLFSWKAFRKCEPEEDYAELCKSFVSYAGGLPLALEILGSFLYKRSLESWSSVFQKLKQIPNPKVFEILKVSFDGLDDMEKKIFLDIACFYRLYHNESMIEKLYSSEFCSRIAIDVLVEKSLLTISYGNHVYVHDLIREMGCEIIRQESFEEPGGRSRLWIRNDIFHVFTKNTGTEAIEGILLDLAELEEADWNLEAFSKICKLKLLYIHNLRLSLGPKYLPNTLRFLNWSWYPSKSLPPCFQPDELTELSLRHSNIDHLWNGIKCLINLKSIDLSYSINLRRTPDFTGIPNLEKLVLEGCANLVKIHPSIALLKRLKFWNFRNCRSIKSLPSEVNMEFLETFDVSGCSKLKMIPEFVGQMKRLSKLCLGGTAVKKLPSSIEHLHDSLVELDFNGIVIREQPCSFFLKLQNLMIKSFGSFQRKIPQPLIPLLASLKQFSSLTTLKLNDCNICEGEIPNDIGSLSSLEWLELRGNKFVSLPASIHLLSKLKRIDVENCKRLQQLPELPASDKLCVTADNCTSLQVFPDPPDLRRLRYFDVTCINCLSMVGNSLLYSVLKRLHEGTPCSLYFQFVIPGSEIPEWFNNQSMGDSVTEKLPSDACNSKWIVFAVCAVIVAQDDLSTVPEDRLLNTDFCFITCNWNRVGYGFRVRQIVSDHLLLVVLPIYNWKLENCLEDRGNEVEFFFETTRVVGSNRCMKVKKCGARVLYEHDTDELIVK